MKRRANLVLLSALFLGLFLSASQARAADICCGITAIDTRTGVVTVRDNRGRCTFKFNANPRDLRSFRIGQPVDKGKGVSSTTSCGSNVGRNEDTKNPPCRVLTQDKGWVPCSK
jgi:hypothetical protein